HRPWYLRVGALIPATVILVIAPAVLLAADAVAAGPQPRCRLPEYCRPGRAGGRRGGGPAPEPRAERQAGVLVVGTPAIHQAAPWPPGPVRARLVVTRFAERGRRP